MSLVAAPQDSTAFHSLFKTDGELIAATGEQRQIAMCLREVVWIVL